MFTANTMSSAMEAMGMSPPCTASGPAVTPDNQLTIQKRADCETVTVAIFHLLEYKIHAKQIMTKEVKSCHKQSVCVCVSCCFSTVFPTTGIWECNICCVCPWWFYWQCPSSYGTGSWVRHVYRDVPQGMKSFVILHFRAEVDLTVNDFNIIGSRVPLLANLKPHGKVCIAWLPPLLAISIFPLHIAVSYGWFGWNRWHPCKLL